MTIHSKAATNDVYDLFNQPLKCEAPKEDTHSGGESDFEDDGYSTAGESTGTGMISGVVSESGNEDTGVSVRTTLTGDENTGSGTADAGGEWTEFSTSKHVPPTKLKVFEESEEATFSQSIENTSCSMLREYVHQPEELKTPVEPDVQEEQTKTKTRFVPIPPEDYDPTPLRTFRDPSNIAQSRLPFMTPIVEKTETSLAANTVYQKDERDYFASKTPSRSSSTNNDSPSKVGVERLLLSSPLAENASPHRSGGKVRSAKKLDFSTSPSPKSKRASRDVLEEQDDFSSPRKRLQTTHVQDSSTRIKVKVSTTPTSPISVNHKNGFIKPTLPPSPRPAPLESKSRIITDLQCNPTDPSIRNQILANTQPPLSSYPGFINHPDQPFGRYTQLQKYAKKIQDTKVKSSPRKPSDKTLTQAVPPILSFPGASRVYVVRRELGQGAFAPVYLVDSYDPDRPVEDDADTNPSLQARGPLEALKAESPPSQAIWEFHIIRTIHRRLAQSKTPTSSTTNTTHHHPLASIIHTHELHSFPDEAHLLLSYSPHGTLLDLINASKASNLASGLKPGSESGGLDEPLALFFTAELLRTVESLHRVGILHGDLKGDNCLVRLPLPSSSSSSSGGNTSSSLAKLGPYSADGSHGWAGVGLTLIDFGRGIDLDNFAPRVGFIADWAAGPTDAPEIREARPWVWQLDCWGVAGVVASLLFGKYLDTVVDGARGGGGLGGKRRYKLKDGLKRYWQMGIWGRCFEALLNPVLPLSTEEGDVQEWLAELAAVRGQIEGFLETEGERRGLRGMVRRVEGLVSASGGAGGPKRR